MITGRWRLLQSEWQTIHFSLSPILNLSSLLPEPIDSPCHYTTSKILFHQHSIQTIRGVCYKICLLLGLNKDCSGEPLSVLINLPLITPSPINFSAPILQYSPKNYGRDIWVWFLVIPHQNKKWSTPLVLIGIKP